MTRRELFQLLAGAFALRTLPSAARAAQLLPAVVPPRLVWQLYVHEALRILRGLLRESGVPLAQPYPQGPFRMVTREKMIAVDIHNFPLTGDIKAEYVRVILPAMEALARMIREDHELTGGRELHCFPAYLPSYDFACCSTDVETGLSLRFFQAFGQPWDNWSGWLTRFDLRYAFVNPLTLPRSGADS